MSYAYIEINSIINNKYKYKLNVAWLGHILYYEDLDVQLWRIEIKDSKEQKGRTILRFAFRLLSDNIESIQQDLISVLIQEHILIEPRLLLLGHISLSSCLYIVEDFYYPNEEDIGLIKVDNQITYEITNYIEKHELPEGKIKSLLEREIQNENKLLY